MQKRIFLLILLCSTLQGMAQVLSLQKDSVSSKPTPTREKVFKLQAAPMVAGGSLLLAGSLLDFDHGGSQVGMDYTPSFTLKADEVLRFVPALTLVGMKLAGVESRTERWGELIVRSAASTALMGLAVEGTKRSVGRVRPDGSDDRSFPSGHSAAAFLTASIFVKEYGHLSPWCSVGAYGVATSTALLRRMNDKHWTGDIMAGAGIGILSAELGYALTDLFYGRSDQSSPSKLSSINYPQSALHCYMHCLFPSAITGIVEGCLVKSRFGYAVGMEAVHWFSPYVGVDGRMGITCSQMELDGLVMERPLDQVSIAVGPAFRLPLGESRLSVEGYARGGYGWYPKADYGDVLLGGCSGWGCEGGMGVGYLTPHSVTLRLTAGYGVWSSPSPQGEADNKGWSLGLSAGWGI